MVFFVSNRPEDDGGTVAVALDEHFQLCLALVGGFKPTGFVHDEEAVGVQSLHERLALRIVAGAVGVRAHLLHQLHLVAVDVIGNCLTHQTAIGVAAEALDLIMLFVDEESAVGIDANGTEAELDLGGIHVLAVAYNGGAERIAIGIFGRPTVRVADLHAVLQNCLVLIIGRAIGERGRYEIAAGIENFASDGELLLFGGVVTNGGFKSYSPQIFAPVDGLCKRAPKVDRNGIGLGEPYVAVDAAALIPPALVLLGVDVDGEDVLFVFTEADEIGDIDLKAVVAAEIVLHEAAVEVDGCVRGNALEQERDAAASVGFVEVEILDVPSVIVLEKAESAVFGFVGDALDDVIVGQVNLIPALGFVLHIVFVFVNDEDVILACGSIVIALGLCRDIGDGLILRDLLLEIAAVEVPILVHADLFSHDTLLWEFFLSLSLFLVFFKRKSCKTWTKVILYSKKRQKRRIK